MLFYKCNQSAHRRQMEQRVSVNMAEDKTPHENFQQEKKKKVSAAATMFDRLNTSTETCDQLLVPQSVH